MSTQQRKEFAYWFMMFAGMFLTCNQLYKYSTNTLELTISECVVCVVAVSFMILPRFILRMFDKFLIKKQF